MCRLAVSNQLRDAVTTIDRWYSGRDPVIGVATRCAHHQWTSRFSTTSALSDIPLALCRRGKIGRGAAADVPFSRCAASLLAGAVA
jgi:hypothetical protein